MYQINIIGAGRLGIHWLAAFSSQGNLHIQQIVSRHLSEENIHWPVVNTLSQLKPADITIICVADDELESTITQITSTIEIETGQLFVHCAGRYSSELLAPLADLGAQTVAIHPLKAFTQTINANVFDNCLISMEGQADAINQIEPILKQLGARPFIIDKAQKTLYHSACTLASNGLVGLAHAANQLFLACGIEPALAKQNTLSLLSASLDNCHTNNSLLGALTGPIARGDKHAVNAHLNALNSHSQTQQLYYHLSEHILSLMNTKVSLDDWLQQ